MTGRPQSRTWRSAPQKQFSPDALVMVAGHVIKDDIRVLERAASAISLSTEVTAVHTIPELKRWTKQPKSAVTADCTGSRQGHLRGSNPVEAFALEETNKRLLCPM
jgi:hypothetical protein